MTRRAGRNSQVRASGEIRSLPTCGMCPADVAGERHCRVCRKTSPITSAIDRMRGAEDASDRPCLYQRKRRRVHVERFLGSYTVWRKYRKTWLQKAERFRFRSCFKRIFIVSICEYLNPRHIENTRLCSIHVDILC